jgi:hypothetical protein
MKYLKQFERSKNAILKGDYVILLYKDDDSPYRASSSEFTIGDIYKVNGRDYHDEYSFSISFCEYSTKSAFTLTGGRTYVKRDQIRRLTDSEEAQIKYNL